MMPAWEKDISRIYIMNRFIKFISLIILLTSATGCVYYNTFYLARKAFNDAESQRKTSGREGAGAGVGQYKKAIEKSEKVIEKWPNSKWYDDALYVSGVSYYYTGEYGKAEKRLRELIANYPESKYIKMSRLYLAQTRLSLGEETSAMTLFEELFYKSKDKEIKAEAAMALGKYYAENNDFAKAQGYFQSVVDSLGDEQGKTAAGMYIADGYFSLFKYKPALENYLEILKYELSSKDKYKATFKAGECYYFLHDIQKGLEYFESLAQDQLYYDSLPAVKLMIAQGYEWDGDLMLAEKEYEEIALENPRHPAGSLANYYLGLIYQYDYENYKKAKEYYDEAKSAGMGSSIYKDALQRSSDIGKLEEYQKTKELDTSASLEQIDKAAETQYLLAELYLTQLGKPDSAFHEFQYVATNFPQAYLAPKALIAVATMERDYYDDTLAFDSTLRMVLREYPTSDFIPDAIDLLGLKGTKADSGYPEFYYEKGENFLFDYSNLDSAKYYFGLVADSFPKSSYNIKAKFALLYITEMYESPGDSSLYYAYAYFADSFPNSEFATAAQKKLVVKPRIVHQTDEIPRDSSEITMTEDSTGAESASEQRVLTPEERYFLGPDGKTTLFEVGQPPTRFDREFRYPIEAYSLRFEGYFYFQLKINPFGEVEELKLMNPSPSEELNDEAYDVVLTAHFETFWIPADLIDSWFVYKYKVELPASIK
jgi:TolA-binding protein